jgi:hypothetical protein
MVATELALVAHPYAGNIGGDLWSTEKQMAKKEL